MRGIHVGHILRNIDGANARNIPPYRQYSYFSFRSNWRRIFFIKCQSQTKKKVHCMYKSTKKKKSKPRAYHSRNKHQCRKFHLQYKMAYAQKCANRNPNNQNAENKITYIYIYLAKRCCCCCYINMYGTHTRTHIASSNPHGKKVETSKSTQAK